MAERAALLVIVFIIGVLYLVAPFAHLQSTNSITVFNITGIQNVTENVETNVKENVKQNLKENVTEMIIENVNEESITDIMLRRKSILRLSCDYWPELLSVQATGTHDDLIAFHSKIYNLTLPAKHRTQENKRNLEYSPIRVYKNCSV